jgi:predicted HTH transcriptional regulator
VWEIEFALFARMHPLLQKIFQGEGQQLEFKFELNSARKIAATLSAFSNTEGGTLLIGVKDNGGLAGIRVEEELYVLDAAASLYCKPAVAIQVHRWELEGKVLLEVEVPLAADRPVKAESEPGEWKAWVRYGASNRLATIVHLEVWKMHLHTEKPAEFSTREERVLQLLREHSWMNLNALIRKSQLHRLVVVRMLASFIRWGLIEMITDESGGFVFQLRDPD